MFSLLLACLAVRAGFLFSDGQMLEGSCMLIAVAWGLWDINEEAKERG